MCSFAFTLEGPFCILLIVFCLLCFAAYVNIVSLRKIKKFSNLRSGICSALKCVYLSTYLFFLLFVFFLILESLKKK